jgi:hypothetical protein
MTLPTVTAAWPIAVRAWVARVSLGNCFSTRYDGRLVASAQRTCDTGTQRCRHSSMPPRSTALMTCREHSCSRRHCLVPSYPPASRHLLLFTGLHGAHSQLDAVNQSRASMCAMGSAWTLRYRGHNDRAYKAIRLLAIRGHENACHQHTSAMLTPTSLVRIEVCSTRP